MDKSISLKFEFCIFSEDEYDITAITGILQIKPSKGYKKDEQYRENKYRMDSVWQLDSGEIFSYFFEEELLRFIKKFEEAIPEINELVQKDKLSCKIFAVIKILNGNSMPAITLDQKTINLLSSFNCSLDLDMYDNRTR